MTCPSCHHLILHEHFAASVGGDTPFDERQDEFESSLERWVPGRLEDRRDLVAVERLTQSPRQTAALHRQQTVVRRLPQSTNNQRTGNQLPTIPRDHAV